MFYTDKSDLIVYQKMKHMILPQSINYICLVKKYCYQK